MTSKYTKIFLLTASALLSACMGAGEGGPGAASVSGLVEVPRGTEPLRPTDSELWREAPRGCRGQLPAEVEFELARDGLVVAVDAAGHAVCVDTVDNVQSELEQEGRLTESSALGDAYLLAMGFAIPTTDIAAGDPSPQPSCEGMDTSAAASPSGPGEDGDIDRGDPSPQPSTNPDVDPGEP